MVSGEAELRSLLLKSLDGDSAAHRLFLQRLSLHLRAYLRRKLLSAGCGEGDAEDLVQETLMAVHTKRATYDPAIPVTAWVHAIARYKLVDHLRRQRRSVGGVALDDVAEVLAEEERAAPDTALDVRRLVATLPDRYRRPIELVKLDGLSVAEAALACNMSESAVKVGVHRGLKVLASAVRGKGRTS